MKKILILYFSGAGTTQKVAQLIQKAIQNKCEAEICAVEDAGGLDLNQYDGVMIGTPVYHAAPARLIMDFFRAMEPLQEPIPAFVYNTRALWSCNTNRILAKELERKNIITILSREYRGPASDGSLLMPSIQRFFEFEKQLWPKIQNDCRLYLRMLKLNAVKGHIPKFRFGSIVNAPNKLAGQIATLPIHLHKNKCTRCGGCIKNCPHKVLRRDDSGYPIRMAKGCENCYRCIHHCPAMALSLSKRKTPNKLLQSGVK